MTAMIARIRVLLALVLLILALTLASVVASAHEPTITKVAELDGKPTVAIADYCGVGNDGFTRVVRVANSGVETWVYCREHTPHPS